jgi:CRISP-associated protein Cas1
MQLLNTLYVTTPDSYLRLENNTLRVEIEEEVKLRVPLHHLQSVVCFGHVGVSLPLMHRLAEDGLTLVMLDRNGRFKARLEGAVSGNVLLRQAQHRRADSREFALETACAFVAGKIKNCRALPPRVTPAAMLRDRPPRG